MNKIKQMYEIACGRSFLKLTDKQQLELLKILIDTDHYIEELFRCANSRAYCLSTPSVRNLSENTFEELIAEVIIRHWDLFVPEEKEKIRGILNEQENDNI